MRARTPPPGPRHTRDQSAAARDFCLLRFAGSLTGRLEPLRLEVPSPGPRPRPLWWVRAIEPVYYTTRLYVTFPLRRGYEGLMTVAAEHEAIFRNTVDVIPREELERRLGSGRTLRVKLGIDPTAPDIHLGFAVVLKKLRAFPGLGPTAGPRRGD